MCREIERFYGHLIGPERETYRQLRKARERQLATLKKGDEMPDVQNSAPREKTRDELATIAGVSHDTIDKMKKIA